ncbi:hypothetical protein Bca52824_083607 [Brassica carinata]|uniref:Protein DETOXIFICATION n=1 Tax=Brassica carinata TaxID=52824 RepID=A0A8X7TU02_BRACI|nr:hypothetical protein Bca52824_083607 [Brassica carinata]
MESGFSLAEREEEEDNKNEKSAGMMMKKVSYMVAPMVAVYLSQYLLQVISMIMAGHLDELSLSSVAIATSLTNVTGFSLLVGFSGALETLCGQAFGAEQFRKIGSYTYSSMTCLVLICFPISLLWVYMDKLLELFHQDPLISELACRYSIWLIPALFGCALLQPMTRYFQSQGLVLPLFLSSFGTLCFHIPLCWLLVYKLRFGIVGAALSIGFSLWLNVALLWAFMRDSSLYCETRNLQAQEIFSSMKQFIYLAIPTAMMTCLEWWSFELLLLLSGLLPNSKLETSVMSICLTTSLLHYVFVDAIGAAASTHVSNELGAGNPKAARAAANAALYLGAFDASFVSITLYNYRKTWAYIFSNEIEVAQYATKITPILCLSIFVCSFTSVLSGIARGVGWQSIAGYASIGSYYLVGIPVGSILCFVAKLRGRGLWIGILIGCFVQTMVLAHVTFFTNWEQEFVLTFSVNIINNKIKKFARTMESGFSLAQREEEDYKNEKSAGMMMKKVSYMAAPMVAVSVSTYLLQVISMVMAGHLDELSLSSVAIATSLTNVTGFSLLSGLASALETLCGQAFGARQYEKLGSYTFTSIVSLLIMCFPISLLWIFMKNLLLLFHQDPEISEIASVYCLWLIPALFGYSVLQSLIRYFQTQCLIFPMVLSSITVLYFHLPVCWVLVYTLGLGTKGAALSISLSYWLNAVFLWFFMRRSQVCEGKCVFISMEAFGQMRTFFSLAVPSALMICLEWSAFEILILISGVLPNSKLETSGNAKTYFFLATLYVTSSSLHYNLASAIGAAASTNVANELGAGNLVAAKASAFVAIMIAAVESSSVSFALFMSSNIWGYAYSNVPEVIHYAAEITPVLCISIVMDSLSASLTGVVRGSGKQKTGAYVNIAAFYIIGIPIGLLFCFMLDFKVKGLWIGVLTGCTVQTITLFLITTFTKWTTMVTEVSTV